ncbi:TetR/AcrR family transcriptional regulator [Kordiimonas aquimaris]|uniref:TetR/AcrR family transcriptional regulator n=1 Tax=Kordiimonas aquimaris TaxID=707591 RepID=UPI0021D0C3A8|nr:TetR/AcrR family transcriptional regulator [Kordiimonas aquimaris]
MNDTKKVGRPKKFDKEQALDAAIKVFWSKGYNGASMKDLTTGMGINGPSLYATFGDKHALYLQAIEAYANGEACAPLDAFENEPDIHLAVSAFLEASISYATNHESGIKGCFVGSCVATSAGEVDGVQPLLHEAITSTDARLTARFEAEKAQGNLPQDFPSAERARLMFDLRQGYVLRARAGINPEAMRIELRTRSNMVLMHNSKQ